MKKKEVHTIKLSDYVLNIITQWYHADFTTLMLVINRQKWMEKKTWNGNRLLHGLWFFFYDIELRAALCRIIGAKFNGYCCSHKQTIPNTTVNLSTPWRQDLLSSVEKLNTSGWIKMNKKKATSIHIVNARIWLHFAQLKSNENIQHFACTRTHT